MRISELSAASGLSIPTIKYYLREGLLHPGRRDGQTRATYDERHVRRLRLIRALAEVGRLALRDVRRVLAATDDPAVKMHELLGTAQYALEPPVPGNPEGTDLATARETVDRLLGALKWQITPEAPARQTLAQAVATLRGLGWDVTPDRLREYASAVDGLAEREVASRSGDPSREETVERMVVGSVVFAVILTALRRLAHEHHSARNEQQ